MDRFDINWNPLDISISKIDIDTQHSDTSLLFFLLLYDIIRSGDEIEKDIKKNCYQRTCDNRMSRRIKRTKIVKSNERPVIGIRIINANRIRNWLQ